MGPSHYNQAFLVLWISKSIFFHIPLQSQSFGEDSLYNFSVIVEREGDFCEPGWHEATWARGQPGSLLSCGLGTWLRAEPAPASAPCRDLEGHPHTVS